MEKAFFFDNGDVSLFAVLHTPEGRKTNKGIIFCHPYGEEKQFSYRIFVRFARQLSARGLSVLRFDCRGYGDSQGDFIHATIENQIADTAKAVEIMRNHGCQEIGLLGLRLGGTIAALTAEREADAGKLILWSPVVNGRAYLNEIIRRKVFSEIANKKPLTSNQIMETLRSKGMVDVEGHYLTSDFYNELSAVDLGARASGYRGRVLVASVKDHPGISEALSQKYKDNGASCVFKAFDEKPFWDTQSLYEWNFPLQLYNETQNWITENWGYS